MEKLGADLDWLDVTTSDNIADLTEDRLKRTDVVMLFTTGSLPMGPMKQKFYDWVRAGGGLVGVHAATDTLADDPDYVAMIGGTFDGHPWNEEVSIIIDDPRDPAMKPFIGGDTPGAAPAHFTIADEIYQYKSLNPDLHVLMSLDPATPRAEPARPYPLAWKRTEGRGRIFYSALGHRPQVWEDQRYIQHVLAGIRWAAQAR
jgi:type 1 glutamine amidotransferase